MDAYPTHAPTERKVSSANYTIQAALKKNYTIQANVPSFSMSKTLYRDILIYEVFRCSLSIYSLHTHILFEIFEPSFNMLYAC